MIKESKIALFGFLALVVAFATLPASAQSPGSGTLGTSPCWGTPGRAMMMGPGTMDRSESIGFAAPVQPASPSAELTFSIRC